IDGLKTITITDREGVTLLKATPEGGPLGTGFETQPALLSTTFAVVSDQASKLGLKKNKSIVSVFGSHQVVQFNHAPFVTTLVADVDANTGILLDLNNELKDVTDVIATALQERQNFTTP
ncbi:9849_t:CDS:2, partial [Ambispora leptoticha]